MELSWFRRPGPQTPGTLNLCYNALDVHVVRGDLERVTLLEQVAALAGVLQGLGVAEGEYVAESLDDDAERALLLLALLRIGAVLVVGPAEVDTRLTIEPGQIEPAVKVGRSDPAGCSDLAPDAAALLVDGVVITQVEVLDREDWASQLVTALCVAGPSAIAPITIGRA